MARARFWKGFAVGAASGAAAGLGAVFAWRAVRQQEDNSVVRLEKSIQIGRPLADVYRAWAEIEDLPRYLSVIEGVEPMGNQSHWIANINGRRVEWDAELVQRRENEALGWKSVGGPKHTGRIDFSRLGNDTLVHVVMNYAPPMGVVGRVLVENLSNLDALLEESLREFKNVLESTAPQQQRATGTEGRRVNDLAGGSSQAQASRFGGTTSVDYTRPPEMKS